MLPLTFADPTQLQAHNRGGGADTAGSQIKRSITNRLNVWVQPVDALRQVL
jgi:hypothetical protein